MKGLDAGTSDTSNTLQPNAEANYHDISPQSPQQLTTITTTITKVCSTPLIKDVAPPPQIYNPSHSPYTQHWKDYPDAVQGQVVNRRTLRDRDSMNNSGCCQMYSHPCIPCLCFEEERLRQTAPVQQYWASSLCLEGYGSLQERVWCVVIQTISNMLHHRQHGV